MQRRFENISFKKLTERLQICNYFEVNTNRWDRLLRCRLQLRLRLRRTAFLRSEPWCTFSSWSGTPHRTSWCNRPTETTLATCRQLVVERRTSQC